MCLQSAPAAKDFRSKHFVARRRWKSRSFSIQEDNCFGNTFYHIPSGGTCRVMETAQKRTVRAVLFSTEGLCKKGGRVCYNFMKYDRLYAYAPVSL